MGDVIKEVYADEGALVEHVADWLVTSIVQSQGRFSIALSGGSTPKPLYRLLASPQRASRIDWSRVHLFWGDERFVPHDHPDSNYLMVKQALIDHVPIPTENVHPIATEGDPAACAHDYGLQLQSYYCAQAIDPKRPLFDVNLLGMGDDGHTASLFPGAPQLDERKEWVLPVIGQKPETRITLSYPALASARAVVFLIAGAGKRAALQRVFAGDTALPAARVRSDGQLIWFLDRAAAPEDLPRQPPRRIET